ncbi:helix-turn-helix domain-containing protein [Kouleothrix sp.]|uniref:helix-turn-helix domain-containing protein n=1 Tax=Kouleothrix sp. TaxID=2779161 RepID=UPI00391BD3E4
MELPRLNSAELVSSFGNDQAALRRYRILAALLREGRPVGEVARTFGISRESIRRMRQAFEREGLAGLQSRKRGGGHLARESPLILAIRQELSVEPGMAAPLLWKRVQARLRAAGHAAPRSTFYRLLAQLRDADADAAREPVRLLRDALADLLEDPPVALGRGELALLLLPDERDPLGRGRRLRDALRAAINRLRPAEAGPVLDDPRWRHYLIIAGEYETGEDRATLQEALALSTSTYSRAKREAIERLVALLPAALGDLPSAEPPEALIAPPPPADDFSHEAELDQYMARLRHGGLALIWGPAGVGKLALAATLAARLQARGQKVIWHTCRPPEAETNAGLRLLLALAAGLALEGRRDLWQAFGTGEAASLARRLDLLAEGLAGRRWTVIVAESQWLTGDEADRVLDVLTVAQARRDIRLALVGRSLPGWAEPERWPALPFPGDGAARRVFLARMADAPASLARPAKTLAGTLRERVAELLAALPDELLADMPPEQLAQLLVALRPLDELAERLRAALRPPPAE